MCEPEHSRENINDTEASGKHLKISNKTINRKYPPFEIVSGVQSRGGGCFCLCGRCVLGSALRCEVVDGCHRNVNGCNDNALLDSQWNDCEASMTVHTQRVHLQVQHSMHCTCSITRESVNLPLEFKFKNLFFPRVNRLATFVSYFLCYSVYCVYSAKDELH